MELHERHHEHGHDGQGAASDPAAGGSLDQLRHSAEQLYRAADAAIDQALSGDSTAFLAAVEQQGGQ